MIASNSIANGVKENELVGNSIIQAVAVNEKSAFFR